MGFWLTFVSRMTVNEKVLPSNHFGEGRTFKLVALDAIVEGDSFYGAIDGKISATVSGTAQGTMLETSAADGEVVEAILA